MKSTRPRRDRDFYPTPYGLALASTKHLFLSETLKRYPTVLDPGAGVGVWGRALRDFHKEWEVLDVGYPHLTGIEIDESCKAPQEYNVWVRTNYLSYGCNEDFDLIIGNPPFSLMEEFVRHSYSLIRDGGYIFFLGRLAFLESRKRAEGLWTDLPLKRVSVLVRRPSYFSTNGRRTTDTLAYAMFMWQKGYDYLPTIDWLDWDYEDE